VLSFPDDLKTNSPAKREELLPSARRPGISSPRDRSFSDESFHDIVFFECFFSKVFNVKARGPILIQAKQTPNLCADSFGISAQVNQAVNDNAARFHRIKQTVTSGTNDEASHGFFKHRRHFRMRPKALKRYVQFEDELFAQSLTTILQLSENLK
jgi:hypothetical protein